MLYTAVSTKINVPVVKLSIHANLIHSSFEDIEPLFSLTSADNFTNSRHEKVASRNSLAVVVESHIECLDFLRIIDYEDRLLEYFLSEISLMLSL